MNTLLTTALLLSSSATAQGILGAIEGDDGPLKSLFGEVGNDTPSYTPHVHLDQPTATPDRFACPYRRDEVERWLDVASEAIGACLIDATPFAVALELTGGRVQASLSPVPDDPSALPLGEWARAGEPLDPAVAACVQGLLQGLPADPQRMATTATMKVEVRERVAMGGHGDLLIGRGQRRSRDGATPHLTLRAHALAPRPDDDLLPPRMLHPRDVKDDFAAVGDAAQACLGERLAEPVVLRIGPGGVEATACGADPTVATCLQGALTGAWTANADVHWAVGEVVLSMPSAGGGGPAWD